jgi:hypothetical protein
MGDGVGSGFLLEWSFGWVLPAPVMLLRVPSMGSLLVEGTSRTWLKA